MITVPVYVRRGRVGYGLVPGVIGIAVGALYMIFILKAESELIIIGLLAAGAGATLAAARLGGVSAVRRSYRLHERGMDALVVAAVLGLTAVFHNDHFVLFLLATVLIYIVACLGLNLQFGYAGMLNFAGGALLGIGGYTAAILAAETSLPSIAIIAIGGAMAALIGTILLPPMLRTRGHYSAVITIAFTLLFTTFLEVNDTLGGPQGLAVREIDLLGWSFNNGIVVAGIEVSFYVNYVVLALVMTGLVMTAVRRMERSWVGLNLDAVRLDETASVCFGIDPAVWRTVAFTVGNFIVGLAGSFYAMMLGYIAPTNFTFGESLILVTIILLGGLGSLWGVILTTVIIIILPEKLQAIQEYRFLLYGVLVMLMLLFRPEGLVPRPLRTYFPRGQR